MIILDRALERRHSEGRPIRVGLVGAGFMAQGIALQIRTAVPGMTVAAISNRRLERAQKAYATAGIHTPCVVDSIEALQSAIVRGQPAVTDDAMLLCEAEGIDVIVEVTGAVEFGARVALEAITNGKPIVLMNAELDATIGPILKVYADQAGVVYTNTDGDQPGVILNTYRFARGIGMRPVLCGNIKGLHDRYRNPTTQKGFAEKWGMDAAMVTSFADGTKISFEQAIVANATGMRVARRGMYGPTVESGTPVQESVNWYPLEDLVEGPGLVDYVVGAHPNPGVFVLATQAHPLQRHYLNLYKLGPGPLYCFYRPYHLCHFEVPSSIGRAVLFGDATIAPAGPPVVDVIATAKIDLVAGQTLDGIGCYMTYGECENSDTVRAEGLLPMGLAQGATLKRDVPKDCALTYSDVELPEGRLCDRLRAEQNAYFASTTERVALRR